jgi:hypothetical protein
MNTPTINTYTIELTNKDGYEWISGGEYNEPEIITVGAPTLEEALNSICHIESVYESMWDVLRKNEKADISVGELLPLNIKVAWAPGHQTAVSEHYVIDAIQKKFDEHRIFVLKELACEKMEEQGKERKLAYLRDEMKKLGITKQDIAD